MEHKRDGLVPIGEVFGGLNGPVKAIREASPQALHHYTRFDQVNQLVGASEADPERGFMARTMALWSLPRSNPGNRLQYKRVNGPFTLIMYSSGETKLPFGNFPRLILAWVSTEAVRTQKPRADPRAVADEVHEEPWGSTVAAAATYTPRSIPAGVERAAVGHNNPAWIKPKAWRASRS